MITPHPSAPASDADLDGDPVTDLDAPADPPSRAPQLRRSAWLLTAGVALLACQQVLGPLVVFRVFAAETGSSHDLTDAVTAAHFTVFGVGLLLLLLGLHRFTSHVHVLATAAQQR